MTPAQALEIYRLNFKGASDRRWALQIATEEEIMAWKKMLTQPDTPESVAALKAYLAARDDKLASPHTKSRLWEEYTDACHAAMKEKSETRR